MEIAGALLLGVIVGFSMAYTALKLGMRLAWKLQGNDSDLIAHEVNGPDIEQTEVE